MLRPPRSEKRPGAGAILGKLRSPPPGANTPSDDARPLSISYGGRALPTIHRQVTIPAPRGGVCRVDERVAECVPRIMDSAAEYQESAVAAHVDMPCVRLVERDDRVSTHSRNGRLRARLFVRSALLRALHVLHDARRFVRSSSEPPSARSTIWSTCVAYCVQPWPRIWHCQPSRSRT